MQLFYLFGDHYFVIFTTGLSEMKAFCCIFQRELICDEVVVSLQIEP